MRTADCVLLTSFSILAINVSSCPDNINVEVYEKNVFFSRHSSMFGTALAIVLTHDSNSKNVLFLASEVENEARSMFLDRGCSPENFSLRGSGIGPTVMDFVQIGANAGNSPADPLFQWLKQAPARATALLVEPLRRPFEDLVANYRGSDAALFYENAAVVTSSVGPGRATLFYDAGTELGSLYPAHGVRHNISVVSTVVVATTWVDLLRKHNFGHQKGGLVIGTLLLDTEGHDCSLLLDFPFGVLRPQVTRIII